MHKIRKTMSYLVPAIACAVLVVFIAEPECQESENKNENKTIATRLLEEIWNQRKLDLIDDIDAAGYVLHMAGSPDIVGPAGHKALIAAFIKAFPDHRFVIEDHIAEGDKVVTRWTASGTHKNELMGIPATNAKMTVTGVSIFRIAGGKIEEEWSNWDVLGMWQQLGVSPPIGSGADKQAAAKAGVE